MDKKNILHQTGNFFFQGAEGQPEARATTVAATTAAAGPVTVAMAEWAAQAGTSCVKSAETITSNELLHQHHLHLYLDNSPSSHNNNHNSSQVLSFL